MPIVSDRPAPNGRPGRGTDRSGAGGRFALFLAFGVWAALVGAPVVAADLGALFVVTEPVGRQIWLNGDAVGLAPLLVDSIPAGEVWIEAGSRPDSPIWRPPVRLRFVVRPGEVDTVRIDAGPASAPFSREPGRVVVSAAPRVTAPPAPRWTSSVGKVLPAAAVILGATGVWSRQRADRAYDDYRQTLDPAAMREHLDDARRRDRIAVACWLGAEACLVTAAWVWLRGSPPLPVQLTAGEGGVRLGVDLQSAWRASERVEGGP